MTIQVKYTPRKTVYIHEMTKYGNVDEMLTALTSGLSPGQVNGDTLKWIDGIILSFTAIQDNTEFIIKERVNGILRWDHVSFTLMEKYQSQITSDKGVIIDVIDVSTNETFHAISKFLKDI